jgi:hypothetical protein
MLVVLGSVWLMRRPFRGLAPIRFEDVARAAGIDFVPFNAQRHSLLPEDVGSGCGWGDFDNDGDEDLFLVNFAGRLLEIPETIRQRPGNRLYRNDGGGRFTDVTQGAGLAIAGWHNACLWLDYDGDGWLDLAVSHFEGVLLFRNRGKGSFEDVTHASGLSSLGRYFMGLCAADYDRDGDLDLYVCGYVKFSRERAAQRPMVAGRPAVWTNPVSFDAEENVLLQNNGDGTFTDTTAAAGVADPKGKSMMAVFADFDNDGWPDLYVANDVSTPDALFHNRQDGTFQEISELAGTHDRRASMGLAVADTQHRGWLDLFATHWVAEDHALWRNITGQVRGQVPIAFDDATPAVGLIGKPTPHVAWGCGLHDFDNDGWPDLLLVNGSTIEDELTRDVLTDPKLLPQVIELFRWDPLRRQFAHLPREAGAPFAHHSVHRGAAFADFDQDGRVDVAVTRLNEPALLLRNRSPAANWLQVRAAGSGKNRFAIGARVHVRASGNTQTREILCGSSYLGNDSFIQHFGLGSTPAAEWVEVRFPSGATLRQTNVRANQVVTFEETEATTRP